MTGEAASPPEGERIQRVEQEPLVIRRRGRRVSTEPPPGYTGEPAQEERQQSTENDAQLRQDVPPHWG